ncbi:hypothetical protein [Terriglobus roseus]|uniref:hypothetical protein n=1 Tax=Terriglobus roseus TaxID=392734 RepID=UPI00094505AF|nr:hypothetical protein [Terriglobus roseus]
MSATVEYGSALGDAIHFLAQPLTALTFVIDLARLQQNPEAWKDALDKAANECLRAGEALDVIRQAAAAAEAEREG